MKKILLKFLVLLSLTLVAASCASTPPATAVAPDKAAAPAMAAVPAPDAELKKAESLKETIEKYQLSFAKPEEFQKGNDDLAAGKSQMGKDNAKAKTLLESASARYQVVFDAGIAEAAKARQIELAAAKKKADDLEADKVAADMYRTGTGKMTEADKFYSEKKYKEAWDASGESIKAFNDASALALSKKMADQAAMDAAVKARRAEMSAAKKRADDAKAEKAAAAAYKLGTTKTAEANILLSEKKYSEAWDASGMAIKAFNDSVETAMARKLVAEESLSVTDKDKTATDVKLEEVSKEIGGTNP